MTDQPITRHTNARNDLTAEYVRSILDYDPLTGVLRWKVDKARRSKAGSIAGCEKTSDGYRYRIVSIDGARYRSHRIAYLIMEGVWPDDRVDHESGNSGDMRWGNLRPASHAQNSRNVKRHKDNRSGYKGVSSFREKWRARIMVDGKSYELGHFKTPEEAHAAYQKAALELHKEFARFE